MLTCTRQLKTTAQLSGIYPPDPEMTVSTQQLFEQFYEAHGKPNDAEKDLLVLVGYVDGNVIDQWCKQKLTGFTMVDHQLTMF